MTFVSYGIEEQGSGNPVRAGNKKKEEEREMKPEEFIKLMRKRARVDQMSKEQKEADEIITKISQNLYMGLKHGIVRSLVARSLKEILSTLPENPTEEDINITIKLIEAIILSVISSILSEGEILTVTPIKDKDKKQSGDKHEI